MKVKHTDPILIPCEGSRAEGHDVPGGLMCRMCGLVLPFNLEVMPDHQRDDVLARIERGDFG